MHLVSISRVAYICWHKSQLIRLIPASAHSEWSRSSRRIILSDTIQGWFVRHYVLAIGKNGFVYYSVYYSATGKDSNQVISMLHFYMENLRNRWPPSIHLEQYENEKVIESKKFVRASTFPWPVVVTDPVEVIATGSRQLVSDESELVAG